MLCLSRCEGESLILVVDGEEIQVKFYEQQKGKRVRLAIDASPRVKIYRQEIAEAIRRDGGTL